MDDGSGDGHRPAPAGRRGRGPEAARPRVQGAGGLVAALNAALAAARAPLVARMDADDRCPPHRLALQAEALDRDPGFTSSPPASRSSAARSAPGMRAYVDWSNELLDDAAIRRDLLVESPLVHPSVMMRTGALRALGGYRDFGGPEDYDLWLRAAQEGLRFGKLDGVLSRVARLARSAHPPRPALRARALPRAKAKGPPRGPARRSTPRRHLGRGRDRQSLVARPRRERGSRSARSSRSTPASWASASTALRWWTPRRPQPSTPTCTSPPWGSAAPGRRSARKRRRAAWPQAGSSPWPEPSSPVRPRPGSGDNPLPAWSSPLFVLPLLLAKPVPAPPPSRMHKLARVARARGDAQRRGGRARPVPARSRPQHPSPRRPRRGPARRPQPRPDPRGPHERRRGRGPADGRLRPRPRGRSPGRGSPPGFPQGYRARRARPGGGGTRSARRPGVAPDLAAFVVEQAPQTPGGDHHPRRQPRRPARPLGRAAPRPLLPAASQGREGGGHGAARGERAPVRLVGGGLRGGASREPAPEAGAGGGRVFLRSVVAGLRRPRPRGAQGRVARRSRHHPGPRSRRERGRDGLEGPGRDRRRARGRRRGGPPRVAEHDLAARGALGPRPAPRRPQPARAPRAPGGSERAVAAGPRAPGLGPGRPRQLLARPLEPRSRPRLDRARRPGRGPGGHGRRGRRWASSTRC